MSADGDSGPGRREVAYRPFAAEFDDASLSYSESDEERAPNYVVTPTGLRVNRLFAVGVLTESESINDETLRGRIVDPTGAFVTYAGQYQPPAQAFLDRTTPPAFVAITGKARTFEPEDSDRVFTSVRPESLSEVDADTRDRWAVSAAESTLERIAVCAAAIDSPLRGDELRTALSEAGVDDSLAAGIPRALDHYGTTTAYLEGLRRLAVDTLELVADEREEVRPLDLAPDEGGDATLGPLPEVDIDLGGAADVATTADSPAEPTADPEVESTPATESTDEMEATDEAESMDEADSTGEAEPMGEAEPTDEAEPTGEAESTSEREPADGATPTVDGTETVDETTETATGAPDEETVDATTDGTPEASDPSSVGSTDTESEPTAAAEPTEPTDAPVDESVDTAPESAESPSSSEATAGADEAATADAEEPSSTDETGMYQLDEEEREELESEFDTGFSSGNEVDPAGEADIDVPDADELAERAEAEADPASSDAGGLGDFDDGVGDFDDGVGDFEDDAGATDESASEPADETDAADAVSETDEQPVDEQPTDQPADDVDLEDAVIETMAQLDDGDGVDRGLLVGEVVDAYGVGEAAVEEAIADALMGGRCYEPADDTLKAI
ncbi:hypothetical protein [Halohasta salina]|uniref:hypothetical protein n=1 Tax=Halohasta salina TaxID=2961621 RepID=UPI0020A54754|nr:hypothetical protein [Halohasta salina]